MSVFLGLQFTETMADTQVAAPAAPAPTEQEQQIAALASFAFQDEKPPIGHITQPQLQQPAAPAQPAAPTAAVQDDEFDIVDPSQYGFDSWETFQTAINDWRTKATSPPQPEPIKWANEHSKTWAQYMIEGKEDELYNNLHARNQVRGLETMSDDAKLKKYISLKNPLFTQQIVDYKFNKDYAFDETPFKDETGQVKDQMGLQMAQLEALQRKQNDLNEATKFFEEYKTKLDLSPLAPPPDPQYEAFKAQQGQQGQVRERLEKVVIPSIQAVKESDLSFGVNVNDPNNQMQFEVSVPILAGDLETAKRDAFNFDAWLAGLYDDKGNFNAPRIIRLMHLDRKFDDIAQTIARQSVNEERRRVLNKDVPVVAIDKNFNQPHEENDIKAQLEKAAFGTFGIK
jgi:hypothetical protein